MKKASALILAATLALQGCATTGSDTDSTGSSGTMDLIGAITGIIMGGAVAYETGDTMQAQQTMNTAWSAFGFNPDGTSSNDSDAHQSSDTSSGTSSDTLSQASSIGGSSSSDSPYVRAAEQKRYSFSPGKCPNDASGVRKDITYPDLLNSPDVFSKSILSMVKEGGGYDTAIALSEAQRVEYIRASKEGANQARDTFSGAGSEYDTSNCPSIDGIYCSGIHTMWMYGDSAIIAEYIIEAMKCNQNAGVSP